MRLSDHQVRERIRRLCTANFHRKIPEGNERWLSAYADASYAEHGEHPGASWGVWIRTNRHRVLRAGPCPRWVFGTGSTYAELCGVYTAIVTALDGLDDRANIMVVKTDCQGVRQWFGWGGRLRFPPESEALRMVLDAFERADAAGVRLVIKWVRGHAKKDTTQGYLNHRVDQMAIKARHTNRIVDWSVEVDQPVAS